ncbi:MAG: hypothetical protein II920_00420 [Clostridia bacterium]|nr:hypothetical protein [Clostridia bacterium]
MIKRSRYKRQWLVGDEGKWLLIVLLVFAFPVGLYIMWDESKWKLWLRILVSVVWTAIIVFAIVLLTGVTEPEKGSVVINSKVLGTIEVTINSEDMNAGDIIAEKKSVKLMLAPLPPEDLPETSKLLRSSTEESKLISEPTPTPKPTMVYCNDNGKYYHLAGCRYVMTTTPRVTLTAAKNAGKTACPDCKPPKEETYENN